MFFINNLIKCFNKYNEKIQGYSLKCFIIFKINIYINEYNELIIENLKKN